MSIEDSIASWTSPSSDTETDKMTRTERMVIEAIASHAPFDGTSVTVFAKGSYPNNTNVRVDSDVDIAVQCSECYYYDVDPLGTGPPSYPYQGPWSPERLRSETVAALKEVFGGQVNTTGATAIGVHSSSARIDADVTPCFDYRYFFGSGYREGIKIFDANATPITNYPMQHLECGRGKNTETKLRFKRVVRILKRINNAMAADLKFKGVASYFVECLCFNCPTELYNGNEWTSIVRKVLGQIWHELDGPEPSIDAHRWVEVNRIKYLFGRDQKWVRKDGRDFALAAWGFLEGLDS